MIQLPMFSMAVMVLPPRRLYTALEQERAVMM